MHRNDGTNNKPIVMRQLARRLCHSAVSINMWLVGGCCFFLRLFGNKILLISHSHRPTAGTNTKKQSSNQHIVDLFVIRRLKHHRVYNVRTHCRRIVFVVVLKNHKVHKICCTRVYSDVFWSTVCGYAISGSAQKEVKRNSECISGQWQVGLTMVFS